MEFSTAQEMNAARRHILQLTEYWPLLDQQAIEIAAARDKSYRLNVLIAEFRAGMAMGTKDKAAMNYSAAALRMVMNEKIALAKMDLDNCSKH